MINIEALAAPGCIVGADQTSSALKRPGSRRRLISGTVLLDALGEGGRIFVYAGVELIPGFLEREDSHRTLQQGWEPLPFVIGQRLSMSPKCSLQLCD